MAFITYVLATAQIAGLDRQGTQSMVAMTLLGMALCTALQAWGGRTGSGALLVHMPNPFMITPGGRPGGRARPGGALRWPRWCMAQPPWPWARW